MRAPIGHRYSDHPCSVRSLIRKQGTDSRAGRTAQARSKARIFVGARYPAVFRVIGLPPETLHIAERSPPGTILVQRFESARAEFLVHHLIEQLPRVAR